MDKGYSVAVKKLGTIGVTVEIATRHPSATRDQHLSRKRTQDPSRQEAAAEEVLSEPRLNREIASMSAEAREPPSRTCRRNCFNFVQKKRSVVHRPTWVPTKRLDEACAPEDAHEQRSVKTTR